MSYRAVAAIACLLALASPAAADPWEAKKNAFGLTALGTTTVAPGAAATDWNVLALGLFCARGQVNLYLYGISDERMSNGQPVRAAVIVDGAASEFSFRHVHDAVVATVPAELARAIMGAKSVSVQVHDYNSPKPDALDMAKAGPTIRSALRGCLKP
jgi:hypothetical protein